MILKSIKFIWKDIVLPIFVAVIALILDGLRKGEKWSDLHAVPDYVRANQFPLGALSVLYIVWLWFSKHQESLSELKKYVSYYERTSRLKPAHVGGSEAWFKPFFLRRQNDAASQVVIKLTAQGNACLTGRPMIGKTRSAYEAMKSQELRGYHVLGLRSDRVDPNSIRIPRTYGLVKPKLIVFLDDINKFVAVFVPNELYARLKDQARDLKILATCRDGIEGEDVAKDQTFGSFILQHALTLIPVQPITEEQGKQIAFETGTSWKKQSFDGTPGSVLADKVAMKQRLEQATDLEKGLMRTLHLMKQIGLTVGDRDFVDAAARDLFQPAANSHQINDAWRSLHTKGFVEYDKGWVELVYDCYIDSEFSGIYDNLGNQIQRLRQFAIEKTAVASATPVSSRAAPAKAEKIQPGLPAAQFNRILFGLTDYASAKAFVDVMRTKGIPRDVATYSILARQAPHLAEAKNVLQVMINDDIKPNVVTYTTLLDKADFAEGKKLLAEMLGKGLVPDVVTYSTLIKKSPNYALAQEVLKEMKSVGLRPNLITFSSILSKTTHYAQGREILRQMEQEGVEPNAIIYSKLFSKRIGNETAEEILDWFDRQRFHSLQPLNALIQSFSRSGKHSEAMKIANKYPHLDASRAIRSGNFGRNDERNFHQ